MKNRLHLPTPAEVLVIFAFSWVAASLMSGHWLVHEVWPTLFAWVMYNGGYSAGQHRD